MYSKIILPASILAGTIIGAGVFSLPFVFTKGGLLTGLFYLLLFAVVFILVDLIYADLIIRTPGDHRFVGYSKIYLGKGGFWAAILMGLIQALFVLTIYLILAPSFFKLFIPENTILHLLIFWFLGSAAILLNIKKIALAEFLITIGIILIILFTFVLGAPNFFQREISLFPFDLSNLIVVGPILFALGGRVAVPEIINYFRETKTPLSFLKKSLIVGILGPAVVYFLFVIGILGLSGVVAEDAVSGLIGQVASPVLIAIGVLGLLSLISSYIVIGLNASRIFNYDLAFPNWLSRSLVIFVPPILYFVGFQNFIVLISFLGGVFLPLESIFVLFMWLKANKKSETPPILIGKQVKMIVPVLLLIFFIVLIYAII